MVISVITLMLLVQNQMLFLKKPTRKYWQTKVDLSTNEIGSMTTSISLLDDR